MHKNIKRLTMMGLGSALIAVSVLAGALTSAAAAHDLHGTYELQTETEPDDEVVVFEATNAIRIDERAIARFSPNGKFAARTPTLRSGGCDIVFEGDPLLFQPDYARNTFVTQPWREKCSSTWTEVVGSTYQHLHLGYQNEDISLCGDGPLAGQFVIIGDDFSCTDFDPLTEPRSAPYSHSGNEVVEFRMYDADGYQNFRLDRIRVVDNPIRVCVHKAGGGLDTVVMNGGAGSPNATCWNLDEGYWNLSGHDVDAHLVTLTGAYGSSSPFAFDDIRITER